MHTLRYNALPALYLFCIGDKRGAGTDANVFVTLRGAKGKTPKLHLRAE